MHAPFQSVDAGDEIQSDDDDVKTFKLLVACKHTTRKCRMLASAGALTGWWCTRHAVYDMTDGGVFFVGWVVGNPKRALLYRIVRLTA